MCCWSVLEPPLVVWKCCLATSPRCQKSGRCEYPVDLKVGHSQLNIGTCIQSSGGLNLASPHRWATGMTRYEFVLPSPKWAEDLTSITSLLDFTPATTFRASSKHPPSRKIAFHGSAHRFDPFSVSPICCQTSLLPSSMGDAE